MRKMPETLIAELREVYGLDVNVVAKKVIEANKALDALSNVGRIQTAIIKRYRTYIFLLSATLFGLTLYVVSLPPCVT